MSAPGSDSSRTCRGAIRCPKSLGYRLAGLALCVALWGGCFAVTPRPADTVIGLMPPVPGQVARPRPAPGQTGPLNLALEDAVLMSLQNNRSLVVQEYAPLIRQTREVTAASAFDPVVGGTVTGATTESPSASSNDFRTTNDGGIALSVDRNLTSGASLEVGFTSNLAEGAKTDSSRLGVSITQPLARGAGRERNLVDVRQAELDTKASEYELRGFTESVVDQVEEAYWDYALAVRATEIYERSLEVAQKQLAETEERIKVGKMPEIERAAAESEVALRQEALINAKSNAEAARIHLLLLVNPPGESPLDREVVASFQVTVPEEPVADMAQHEKRALELRPDLNQARLQVKRGDLEIVRTRNGLLPKLDLFVTLGKTGYSDSFGGTLDFGGRGYDLSGGVTLQFALGNRAARAADQRAALDRRQSEAALANMVQLARVDVRNAHLDVIRLREQITATASSRKLLEEKLRAETEKYRVGRSTSMLVAQAQRDLLSGQIDEIRAVAGYLKALTVLYRQEGSLLNRRGIRAPGAETVSLPASGP